MKRACDNCGEFYTTDQRNLSRGWGLCCSKSCAATLRERKKYGKWNEPLVKSVKQSETSVEYRTNDRSVYVPKGCYYSRDVNGDINYVDYDPNSWRNVR